MAKPWLLGLIAALVGSTMGATPGVAGLDADARCRVALYKAAAKYQACQTTALAREVNASTLVIGGMSPDYQPLAARCRAKYIGKWPLQASLVGAARCTGPRFFDNGDGTVTDFLTGLVWEIKTDDGGLHDKDDAYTWSSSGSAADGSVFTSFLPALNTVPCFAGACDWRLPTIAELQTLLVPVVPCTNCLDLGFPGQGTPSFTLTASEDPDFGDLVREVSFATGALNNGVKTAPSAVRAVRGGW